MTTRGLAGARWPYLLRAAEERDAPTIARIRNHAVDHGVALWTDQRIDEAFAAQWIRDTVEAGRAFLVAEHDGVAVAYANYGLWRPQISGFVHSVEDSVYVDDEHHGHGIGKALLTALVDHARTAGHHVMLADIDSNNVASIRLHEQLGFHVDGTFREVGTKFGRWLDLTIMSLHLAAE